jgi:aspartyl-tRNA(Asn)/glutamyl-tRNA(Gln) amidotransferase subunit A
VALIALPASLALAVLAEPMVTTVFFGGTLLAALGRGVKNLRIGVDEDQWGRADSKVARVAEQALGALESEGARLVHVRTRYAHHAAAIGYLTIGLEGFSAMLDERERLDELGLDLQLTLTGLERFPPDEYLKAQRLRAHLRRETAGLLADVDVLALPTAGGPPPAVTDKEDEAGFIDPPALDSACRFAFLGNLTGLPAGTAPVGADSNGLPVGLQIMGDAWDEACVLQVLGHMERMGLAELNLPSQYTDLLKA